jgi:hypothetical protein
VNYTEPVTSRLSVAIVIMIDWVWGSNVMPISKRIGTHPLGVN